MQTSFIVVLSLLLVGVSGWFYYDHSTLSQKSAKQAANIRTLLTCASQTDVTYQKTKKYVSVVSCVKKQSAAATN